MEDAAPLEQIRQIHGHTNQAYGAPRILLDLRHDHGMRVGQKRVTRDWDHLRSPLSVYGELEVRRSWSSRWRRRLG